jgi:hypothetical protein
MPRGLLAAGAGAAVAGTTGAVAIIHHIEPPCESNTKKHNALGAPQRPNNGVKYIVPSSPGELSPPPLNRVAQAA